MDQPPYQISRITSYDEPAGQPIRTNGCLVLFCLSGCATVECNFRSIPFRKGDVVIVFSDTLFTMKSRSRGFAVHFFELSVALTDEATFSSTGAFFDWLYENPVFRVPDERQNEVTEWLSAMDRIERNAIVKFKNMMVRNQWQNFFLGLESAIVHLLSENDIKPASSTRKLFDGFCRLLSENYHKHHDVGFYADKLCITPYYLFCITKRTYGVSPKELIDRLIVMEIKSLLTTSELTVKEIVERFNFESSSYLGRYFRRHTGMTPSEYRSRHC